MALQTNDTKKNRLQIHYSTIDMLNICGIRFEFRYVKGVKIRPNASMLAGTGTDRGVTADLTNKIDKGELLGMSELTDIVSQAVQNESEKEEIELDEEEKSKGIKTVIGETKDKAVRLIKVHHGSVAPTIKPASVQRKFSIDMDGYLRDRAKQLYEESESATQYYKKIMKSQARALNALAKRGVDFVGEIDIFEKDGTTTAIRDTKTSTKSPTEDAALKSEQLTAYALASNVLDGQLPKYVALDYLVDLKREPKAVTRTSERDMEAIEVFLRRLTNAIHSLHSGIFIPASPSQWQCSERYCGYHSICDFVQKRKTIVDQLVKIET